jgi:D-inositol-3-phosphate glycosyltransferase
MRHSIAVIAYHSSPLLEPGTGDAGGMTIYVREVASVIAKLGMRTDVFTRSATGTVEVADIYPGVRIVAIPAGPPGELEKLALAGHIDEFVEGVKEFARRERRSYSVIHSHYWQSGIAGAALARSWGVPLVHSNHTLAKVKNGHLPPGDVPEPAIRLEGESQVIAAADTLIASTDEEWQHLACLYGAHHDRLKTIYPGVDHALFSPGSKAAARAELGLSPDEAVLLFVGRIQPLKGLDLALRALEQLVPALDREVKLLVVGGASGPTGARTTEELAALATSLGIADSVRFEGPQPHERTPLYYRAADACVVCSFSESFGLSALEAQACGIPVVGTDVGGLRHIVRDGASGSLLESRDPSEFAARTKTLLSDPDLQRAFSAEAVRSSRSFTWDRTGSELAQLYECLITERSPELCTC